MFTECPECETIFRVTPVDLRRAAGKVRCGECDAIFNALESLADTESEVRDYEPDSYALSHTEDVLDETAVDDSEIETEEPAESEVEPEAESERDWLETGSLEFDIPPQKWSKFFNDDTLLGPAANETVVQDQPDAADDAETSPERNDDHIDIDSVEAAEAAEDDTQPGIAPPPDSVSSTTDTTTQEEAEWMRALYDAVGDEEPVFVVEQQEPDSQPDVTPEQESTVTIDAADDELAQTDSRSEPVLSADWEDAAEAQQNTATLSEETGEIFDASDADSDDADDDDKPGWTEPAVEHDPPVLPAAAENESAIKYWHEVGSDAEAASPPTDEETETAAPPWADRTDANPEEIGGGDASLTWGIAAAALIVLLLGQLLHYQRDSLATHDRYGALTRGFYTALNIPLYPNWDISSYEIRGSEAVAGEKGSDSLEIRGQIAVVGDAAVGPPLLQVLLRDRWANIIAGGVFSPSEYYAEPNDYESLLNPGSYVPLHITVNDPGAAAQGYELQLCLQKRNRDLQCSKRRSR